MAIWRSDYTIRGRQGNGRPPRLDTFIGAPSEHTNKESALLLKYSGAEIADCTTQSTLRSKGVVSKFPAEPINMDLAIEVEWLEQYVDEGNYWLVSNGNVFGNISDCVTTHVLTSNGNYTASEIAANNTTTHTLSSYGRVYNRSAKSNWVQWSKVGSLDFTIDKANVAGSRPLDWTGMIYGLKKLGNKVVVYGENGISFLIPSGKTYGLNTIHRTGLKGKSAFAGNEGINFFLDNKGQLFSLTDSIAKLDYSEYLSSLSSDVVLSYDAENMVLYICDDTYGFIYSPSDKSMGTCGVNITGIDNQDGNLYVAASDTISTPLFEICTDIYNAGTNRHKTVFEVDCGTSVQGCLQAQIDYKGNIQDSFTKTVWESITDRGGCFLTALGREFRFRLKSTPYEYFELDYIEIRGVKHDQ